MDKDQIKQLIDSNYPNNFNGDITPGKEREVLKAIVDYAEEAEGGEALMSAIDFYEGRTVQGGTIKPKVYRRGRKDIIYDITGAQVIAPAFMGNFVFIRAVELRGVRFANDGREFSVTNRSGGNISISNAGSEANTQFESNLTIPNDTTAFFKSSGGKWIQSFANVDSTFSDTLDSVNAKISRGPDGKDVLSGVFDKNTGSEVQFKEVSTTPPVIDGHLFVNAIGKTLKRVYPMYLNVKDIFGAKGDGETDDTAAIQLAFNVADKTGGTVFFPEGIYITSKTLILWGGPKTEGESRGVGIIGESRTSTVIKKQTKTPYGSYPHPSKSHLGDVDAVILMDLNSDDGYVSNNVDISSITLDGQLEGSDPEYPNRSNMCDFGIYSEGSSTCNFKNTTIFGSTALYNRTAYVVTYDNLYLNCVRMGFVLDGTCTSLNIRSTYVIGSQEIAFQIRGHYSTVQSLAADNCQGVIYKFQQFQGSADGMGAESRNADTIFRIENSRVSVDGFSVVRPLDIDGAIFDCSGSFVEARSGQIVHAGLADLLDPSEYDTPRNFLYKMSSQPGTISLSDILIQALSSIIPNYSKCFLFKNNDDRSRSARGRVRIKNVGFNRDYSNGGDLSYLAGEIAPYIGSDDSQGGRRYDADIFSKAIFLDAVGHPGAGEMRSYSALSAPKKGSVFLDTTPETSGAFAWVMNIPGGSIGDSEYFKVPVLLSGGDAGRPTGDLYKGQQYFHDTNGVEKWNGTKWLPLVAGVLKNGFFKDSRDNIFAGFHNGETGIQSAGQLINPAGGSFKSPSAAGAIKISIPFSFGTKMVTIQGDVYDYSEDRSFSFQVSLFLNQLTGSASRISANILGGDIEHPVRIYRDELTESTDLYIGNTDYAWINPSVNINRINFSHNSLLNSNLDAVIGISIEGGFSGTLLREVVNTFASILPPTAGNSLKDLRVGFGGGLEWYNKHYAEYRNSIHFAENNSGASFSGSDLGGYGEVTGSTTGNYINGKVAIPDFRFCIVNKMTNPLEIRHNSTETQATSRFAFDDEQSVILPPGGWIEVMHISGRWRKKA